MSTPGPVAPQLDDAQRARLAAAAAGMDVAPGTVVPADVDVDAVAAAQLTREQVRALNAAGKSDDVERARQSGRLLGLTVLPEAFAAPASSPTPHGQLTREDVQRMAAAGDHAGIEQARREGKLDHLLGGTG